MMRCLPPRAADQIRNIICMPLGQGHRGSAGRVLYLDTKVRGGLTFDPVLLDTTASEFESVVDSIEVSPVETTQTQTSQYELLPHLALEGIAGLLQLILDIKGRVTISRLATNLGYTPDELTSGLDVAKAF
jgi:hypothetical protein